MAFKKQVEGTRITRRGDLYPKDTSPSLAVVALGRKCPSRPTITPSQTCAANLYRCTKKGENCKGKLVPSRKQDANKLSGTKCGLLCPERVPRPLLEPYSTHSYRQQHSGCLRKQGRKHKVGPCTVRIWTPMPSHW